jgi:hypothetical protein
MNKKVSPEKRIAELEKTVRQLQDAVKVRHPHTVSLAGCSITFTVSWDGNVSEDRTLTIGETVQLLLDHNKVRVNHTDEKYALESTAPKRKKFSLFHKKNKRADGGYIW